MTKTIKQLIKKPVDFKVGWQQGQPESGRWVGRYIKHSGGHGKVTAEHPQHVVIHNGISEYPVAKTDVHSHFKKEVPLHVVGEGVMSEGEGEVTTIHHSYGKWVNAAKKAGAKQLVHDKTHIHAVNHQGTRFGHYSKDDDVGHLVHGPGMGDHITESEEARNKLLQGPMFKKEHRLKVKANGEEHMSVKAVAAVANDAAEKTDGVSESVDDELVTEAKRKKFLGQFRGRTATGSKANAIDTSPSLKLNKGRKTISSYRTRGK